MIGKFEKRGNLYWFLVIILVAVVLRFTSLTLAPIMGDEPAYAVRSFGWIDVLWGTGQTTPYHWFEYLPLWSQLSFHDHPPMVFAVQHIFQSLFGDSLFSVRLSSAFFGVLSVVLVFFIGRRLFNEKVGLLSMALMAVSGGILCLSRVALMESVTTFFVLLAFYFFIRSFEDKKFLPWFGVAIGLSLLSKYTAFIPIPIYFLILIFHKRNYFREWRLYFAIFCALLVFSPVIIYNTELYLSRGHFDVQISYFLHQDTEWSDYLVGKEQMGTVESRVIHLDRFVKYTSLPLFVFMFSAMWWFLIRLRKLPWQEDLIISVIFFWLWSTLLTGSAWRFLYYILPFLFLITAVFVVRIPYFQRKWFRIVLLIVIGIELFFSVNNNFLVLIKRGWPWNFSYITYSSAFVWKDHGVEQLYDYFQKELGGKSSIIEPKFMIKNIDNKIGNLLRIQNYGKPYRALIIHDERVEYRTFAWVFTRLCFYHGWPALRFSEVWKNYKQISSLSAFKDAVLYFVVATKNAELRPEVFNQPVIAASALQHAGINPVIIYNRFGAPVFRVFKLTWKDLAFLEEKK